MAEKTTTNTQPIDDRDRHLIERRDGDRIYKRCRCIRCRADKEKAEAWLDKSTNRLHEKCNACGRTTSWPYSGQADAKWKPTPTPATSKRDAQMTRVYSWERNELSKLKRNDARSFFKLPSNVKLLDSYLSEDSFKQIVNDICTEEKMPAVTVEFQDHKVIRSSCSWGEAKLSIHQQHRNHWIALHELAHWYMHKSPKAPKPKLGEAILPHGPEFLEVYMNFLSKYLGFETADLRQSAEAKPYALKLVPLPVAAATPTNAPAEAPKEPNQEKELAGAAK